MLYFTFLNILLDPWDTLLGDSWGFLLGTLAGEVGIIETAEFKLSPAGILTLFTVSTYK